jgi:hypothetical protein
VLRTLGRPHLDVETACSQDLGVEFEMIPVPDAPGVRVAYDDDLSISHFHIIALSPRVTVA